MAEPPPLPPHVLGPDAVAAPARSQPGLVAVTTDRSVPMHATMHDMPAAVLDVGQPIDELVGLAADEEKVSAEPRRSDLRVRLALLAWDGRGDLGGARDLLDGTDHPVADALRLHLAMETGDRAALATLTEAALTAGDLAELVTLGDLWLIRAEDVERAAVAYAAAQKNGRRELAVALAYSGRWQDLLALWSTSDKLDELLAGAELAQDRLNDVLAARRLLQRAAATAKASPAEGASDARLPYLTERQLELGVDRIANLRLKLERLSPLPRASAERAATQYALAVALEEDGAPELARESAELYGKLASSSEGGESFGTLLALRAQARVAAARGDWAAAAHAWKELSQKIGDVRSARACARRAAELYDTRVGDSASAERIYHHLHDEDPPDFAVGHALACIRLGRKELSAIAEMTAAMARADNPQELVRAARAFEAVGDARAVVRWNEIVAGAGGPQAIGRAGLEAQARIHRRAQSREDLIKVYRRLVPTLDARAGATYLLSAAVLLLERGRLDEAESLLGTAAALDPTDILTLVARALCQRAVLKHDEYIKTLAQALLLARSPGGKARLLRELARTAADELGDRASAERHYARALEIDPHDPATLSSYARLCGDMGNWPRAVELREQALLALVSDAAPALGVTDVVDGKRVRAAELLCEIGDIWAQRLADDERARHAYDRAHKADPRSEQALVSLAALHRRHLRHAELLAVLQQQLLLAHEDEHLPLHLEIAHVAEAEPSLGDLAARHYRAALDLEPGNPLAIAGFERLCRAEGRWQELVGVLERAPQTKTFVRVQSILAEALEHLEDWKRLAEVLEQQTQLLEIVDRREAARSARKLAQLYEERLHDPDAAARAWHRVEEGDSDDLEAPRALQRIYELRGRFADLAAAIEHELTRLSQRGSARGGPSSGVPINDEARQLELWLRLGEVRAEPLGQFEQSADAYEAALRIDPTQQQALSSLVNLYTQLQRDRDLERVLDLRAAVMTDPRQRAGVLLQKGDLLERANDLDGALGAYQEAFGQDPANRTLFTALERVAYRRERWPAAMDLYDQAIALVEVQKLRAYRLADLYLRRGQVQLQYLGQPGEAAASYLRVLELDPESDAAQQALERLFSAQSDWEGLIRVYERRSELVREDAKRVEILRRAARVAATKLRDAQQAARLYARIHSVDPTDAEALDALERHYERVRDWEKLVEVLRTRIVLTTGGDEAIALYLRIAQLCEEGLRDADKSIEAYRKILDVAPSHREALDALGRLYEGTEKWPELVEITRRQIRIVTDRAQKAILYFKCGSVMELKFGKDDDAIRYYDAAIKTSPACLPAVHGLRDLYLRREDWPRVVESLTLEAKLWSEDKERAGVYAHIGTIAQDKLHDEPRAIQYFESALAVDQECLPANRALFDLYFARGDYARALPLGLILTQKVMREGDPAARSEFYRKRALVALHTGDPSSAADALVVALEIRPENVEALDLLVGLCRTHPGAYDYAATVRELEKVYRAREAERLLARVMVAQGAILEHAYDLDLAEKSYLEGLKLAPFDYPVVEPLVDLHFKLLHFDIAASVLVHFLEHADSAPARIQARLRLAEVYSDGAMDPRRAADALETLIVEAPTSRDAHFRLAQEMFLLGRFVDAQKVCERLINLAAQPGNTAPPEELARYYDYLGRIFEATGDGSAAQRSYRRAVDLDPSLPSPVLSLARRATVAGDATLAASLVEDALRAATQKGEPALIALKRGLARFFTSMRDLPRAIALYRETIAWCEESGDTVGGNEDRVALADLYLRDPAGVGAAREELVRVLERDLRAAPAYRLLSTVYVRAGETERAQRVQAILVLLGYSDPGDKTPPPVFLGKRGTLGDDLRRSRLLPPSAQSIYTELLGALREALDPLFPPPSVTGELIPIVEPALKVDVSDVQRLLGVEAEVVLAQGVPGGAVALETPRPFVVFEAALALRPDGERRFLLGRALEPVRGGYTLPLRLRAAERAELGRLLEQVLLPEGSRDPQVQQFLAQLPRKAARTVEKIVQTRGNEPRPPLEEWLASLAASCDRAGLLACDDVGAAARMLARLDGEELAVSPEGAVALGQVAGGAELVRFFLSDAYHELRQGLSR